VYHAEKSSERAKAKKLVGTSGQMLLLVRTTVASLEWILARTTIPKLIVSTVAPMFTIHRQRRTNRLRKIGLNVSNTVEILLKVVVGVGLDFLEVRK